MILYEIMKINYGTNNHLCIDAMHSGDNGILYNGTLGLYAHRASWKTCLTTVGVKHTTFEMLAQRSAIWATQSASLSMWYFGTQSSSFDINAAFIF